MLEPAGPQGCEVGEGRIAGPPGYCAPEGGAQDIGRIEFAEGRAVAVCNSDTFSTPDPTPVQYGQTARNPGSPVNCLVEQTGVTCVDTASRSGFVLARGRYEVF